MTSAYPIAMPDLVDRVRDRATELRAWPSRNQVMTEFKVGGPKAKAALTALRDAGFDPTDPTAPTIVPALRAVPDLANDADAADISDSAATGETAAPDAAGAPDAVDVPPLVSSPVNRVVGPGARRARVPRWPLLLIAAGAFVSIWGGWVGLGELTGFGPIRLLPGIWDEFVINSAITLPIGVEAYAAFALWAWLAPSSAGVSRTARRFARWSAIGALALGAAGQIAYHLMVAAGVAHAPWPITAFVACLPVVVLGCGAALAHLIHRDGEAV
ncbi:ABC transporter permease [Pseudonocardia sichuanensis]